VKIQPFKSENSGNKRVYKDDVSYFKYGCGDNCGLGRKNNSCFFLNLAWLATVKKKKEKMRKNSLIILLIIVATISGCVESTTDKNANAPINRTVTTQENPSGITPLSDILLNYENYENRDVTILGTYSTNLLGEDFLIDTQGYRIKLNCEEKDRIFILGERYRAVGRVGFDEICECQSRIYINLTQEEVNELIELNITNYYGNPINMTVNIKPLPNEGWYTFTYGKIEKDGCVGLTYENKEIIGYVQINQTTRQAVSSFRIFEYRCDPVLIERSFYLQCTESMIKK